MDKIVLDRLKNITFPLRATLVTAVVTLAVLAIALTVGAVGVPAYTKAKKEIRDLWKDLAKQVAETATGEILSYFQTAPITLKFIDGLVKANHLSTQELNVVFDICHRALLENPSFMTVYYADREGTFYGVFRIGDGFLASFRTVVSPGKTRVLNYEITKEGKWAVKNEETTDYDPRNRPFWKTGEAHKNGGWTDPYQFITTKATGYTYVLGYQSGDILEGYWAVDYQIDHLADFLKTLDVGKKGVIYILGNQGEVIANSIKEKDANGIGAVWARFVKSGKKSGYLYTKHKIYYLLPFPQKSEIPWNLVAAIDENDFLVPIRNKALKALYWGLIPCFFFLLVSGAFFGAISRRLKEIARDMDQVGNLAITLKEESGPLSRIREVNTMEKSLYKMKVGLQSFSKYVPLDLVSKLIQGGAIPQLGGDKRPISVMFADLAKFTSIAEKLEPKETAKILEIFLDAATKEVHKEKGTIDKFIGDSVMAIWGAPDPHPEYALASCKTALSLKKLSRIDPRMNFKIGINSGEAMVGNFGSHERMDYTAIGDTVNIAARLEKINKIYGTKILIGPETAKSVEKTLLVRPLDWVTLQGREQPLIIYELIGEKKEAPNALIEAVESYSEGLQAYRSREFSKAKALFEKANTLLGGTDTPCRILIAKCFYFEKQPPSLDWNGTGIIDEIG